MPQLQGGKIHRSRGLAAAEFVLVLLAGLITSLEKCFLEGLTENKCIL